MVVKKYKTSSIQDGIKKIKKELGPDAMILSTRRIQINPNDPYGKDRFEITALPGGIDEFPLCNDDAQKDRPRSGKNFPDGNRKTIMEELYGIKEMLLLLNQPSGIPEVFQTCPDSLLLYSRLINAGISENRTKIIFQNVFKKQKKRKTETPEIARQLFKEVVNSITVVDPFQAEDGLKTFEKPKFATFIGPTGVGKTTTIAKLAADLSLKQKKKVGLISIDNYRIGAVEQLKTYAAIIGIPCLTAFTREDITSALHKMRKKDLVLIDTAGHSHLDTERMSELINLLGGELSASCHLVLSATTKRQDMKEATKYFSGLNPQTYIFTKIDETKQRGGILDQILDYDLPVSYITFGQKVPEDIMCATKQNVSRLILNKSRYLT